MNGTTTGEDWRILVIDDNRAIHDDFRKVLSPKVKRESNIEAVEEALFGAPAEASGNSPGFEIDSAYQGKEGLALVEQAVKQNRPYAMAFVDVRMPPGWDGIETAEKIWEVDPETQIVICTAYSDYSWDDMLRKLGQTDKMVILKKPFDNIEVMQLASSLTRKWQLQRESTRKLADLEKMVAARTAQIGHEQEKFRNIFENSPEGIFQTTLEGRFLSANPTLAAIYGYASPGELMAHLTDSGTQLYVQAGRRAEWQHRVDAEEVVREFESEVRCKDGSTKWISETACKVKNPDGTLRYYQGFVVDITAQKKTVQEHQLLEAHLRQAQKLESVGQLAAGIAHEINTPIQYVGDNIRFVEESFVSLSRLLEAYQAITTAARTNSITPETIAAVDASSAEADLEYLKREIPLAIRQSLEGVGHVANIVRAMKEFSHPGTVEKAPTDLNRALQNTAIVARNEWKYVAELETDLDPELPLTPCLPGEFNQVILNLIVNAAHAIGDVVKDHVGTKGRIVISTKRKGDWAEIRVSDTGGGIPAAIRPHIFEPFFTTKEVGKGTGQGLAIARATIVKKHGGELNFESTEGVGTTFIIRLPLAPHSPQ